MCGIVCYSNTKEMPVSKVIEKMTLSLKHRGPDNQSFTQFNSTGLGHSHLNILDTSTASHQPMKHQKRNWWIIYNGEIYNHKDLRRQLPYYNYQSSSDTETLLHGLASEGKNFLTKCDGMFAFIILDLEENKLLVGRDRFGVKPLYIANKGGELWLASEITSIIAGGLSAVPRIECLKYILNNYWVNGKDTPLKDIERVLPGSFLTINLNNLNITYEKWFCISSFIDKEYAKYLQQISNKKIIEELENKLRNSVKKRMLGKVNIGVLCSGGIDSSLITVLSSNMSKNIRAYNLSTPNQPSMDEEPWARKVCEKVNVDLVSIKLGTKNWRRHFIKAIKHFEYPLVHESSVALSMISEQAQKDGIRILMSGDAADELFGGYGSRHLLERINFSNDLGACTNNFEEVLQKQKAAKQFSIYRNIQLPNRAKIYEKEVYSSISKGYSHHLGNRHALETAITSDVYNFLSHALCRLDKNIMSHSIEPREPFLGNDIVKFALNAPLEKKVLPLKGILLDVAKNHLPPEIISRPKIGFSFDTHSYITCGADSQILINGVLREIFAIDKNSWAKVVNEAHGRKVLRLWSLEIWSRLIIHGQNIDTLNEKIWR